MPAMDVSIDQIRRRFVEGTGRLADRYAGVTTQAAISVRRISRSGVSRTAGQTQR